MKVTNLSLLAAAWLLAGCSASGGLQLGSEERPVVAPVSAVIVVTHAKGRSFRAELACGQTPAPESQAACRELQQWFKTPEQKRERLSNLCTRRSVLYEVQLSGRSGPHSLAMSFSDVCQAAQRSRALIAWARR